MDKSKTSIILVGIIFGIIVISFGNSYAIDYIDSTGYTPDWAFSLDDYQTLAQCTSIIGVNSLDGNWCFEWTANTIDNYDSKSSFNLDIDESLKSYLPNPDKLNDNWLTTGFIEYGFFKQPSLKQFNIISELSRGYQLEDRSFRVVVTVGKTNSNESSDMFFKKVSDGIKEKFSSDVIWSNNKHCFGFIDRSMDNKSLQYCVNNEYIFQVSVIGNANIVDHKTFSNEFSEIINNNFESKIPEWIKNTMKWYVEDLISDDEMIKAIEYLVKEGIIKV